MDLQVSFRNSIGSHICDDPSWLPQRDELAPKTPTFTPQTVLFLSPSLNRRDFDQLVTVVRVLIYQPFTHLAFLVISTLARSRKKIDAKREVRNKSDARLRRD